MLPIEDVKQLREETGMSVSDCKKALEQGGSMEKAREILRQRGAQIAEKKQTREAGEGMIDVYLHPTGKTGVILDLRSETDFVAKSPDFRNLAHELSLQIASMDPSSPGDLLSQAYIRDSSKTVQNLVEEYIAKLGENIVVKQFTRYQI
jgi:elongation factor Ts